MTLARQDSDHLLDQYRHQKKSKQQRIKEKHAKHMYSPSKENLRHDTLEQMQLYYGGSSYGNFKGTRNKHLTAADAAHGQHHLTAMAVARRELKSLHPDQKDRRKALEHTIRNLRQKHGESRGIDAVIWKGATTGGHKKSVAAFDNGGRNSWYKILGGSRENKTKDYTYYKQQYNKRLLAATTVQEREKLRAAWRAMRKNVAHSTSGMHRKLSETNAASGHKLAAYRDNIAKHRGAFRSATKSMSPTSNKFKRLSTQHQETMRSLKHKHLTQTPSLLDSRTKILQLHKTGELRTGNVQRASRPLTRQDLKKLIGIHYDAWNKSVITKEGVSLTHALQRKFQESVPTLVKTYLEAKTGKVATYATTGVGALATGAFALTGGIIPAAVSMLATSWIQAKVGAAVQETPGSYAPVISEVAKVVGTGAKAAFVFATIVVKGVQRAVSIPASMVFAHNEKSLKRYSHVFRDIIELLVGKGMVDLAHQSVSAISSKVIGVFGAVFTEFFQAQLRYYIGPGINIGRLAKVLNKHKATVAKFILVEPHSKNKELSFKYLFMDAVDAMDEDAILPAINKLTHETVHADRVSHAKDHKEQKRGERLKRRGERRSSGGNKGFAGFHAPVAPAKKWLGIW